jgi:hypothetical protein
LRARRLAPLAFLVALRFGLSGIRARRLAPLALVVALLSAILAPALAGADERGAARHLQRIRHDAARLHAFLWDMPKGGDLHMHLSGAVYAESMLRYGAKEGQCLDPVGLVATPPPCEPGQRPLADALSDKVLQSQYTSDLPEVRRRLLAAGLRDIVPRAVRAGRPRAAPRLPRPQAQRRERIALRVPPRRAEGKPAATAGRGVRALRGALALTHRVRRLH